MKGTRIMETAWGLINSRLLSWLILYSMIVLSAPTPNMGQTPTEGLLTRHYHMGEKLSYHMKATHRDRVSTTAYEIDAIGVVKKNDAGSFVEEYAWVNLAVNNGPANISPEIRDFRQILSLDPGAPPSVPNLGKLIEIVGPITDMLTFYADLSLAARLNKFAKPGDNFCFAGTADKPNSWADGVYILIGENAIAFDITLIDVDLAHHLAALEIRHVPPANSPIRLPAEWMRSPVIDTPNNWVEVQKNPDGTYAARVGKETFDVQLKVSLIDGKLLAATLENSVEVLERVCRDQALTSCGESIRYQILRHVEATLQPHAA